MDLAIKLVIFVVLLMIPFSGAVRGDEIRMPSDLTNVYGYNEGRLNLFIGGIGQEPPGPETNKNCKTFADQIGAMYIPTYYSGEWLIGDIPVGDVPQVNNAASCDGFYLPTPENGLTNTLLHDETYDTIIAHSGGTVTAVTALDRQNVICNTLILISPMIGVFPEELKSLNPVDFYKTSSPGAEKREYIDQIHRILNKNKVQKIVVIQSKNDNPLFGSYYQGKFQKDKDYRIEVHNIDLEAIYGGAYIGEHTGNQIHIDLFKKYAMNNIKLGVDGKVYCNPPTVQAFRVTGLGSTAGESFTISYTVASDHGYSGLKQVELWRSDEKSDWQEVKGDTLSGNDYRYSGSFTDSPQSPGKYWYGVHVVDNAGNWNDERNSNTIKPSFCFKPEEVDVSSISRGIVGEWTLYSRESSRLIPIDSTITFNDDMERTLYDSLNGPGHWSQSENTIQWEYDNCGGEVCTRDKTKYTGTIGLDMKGTMQICDGNEGDWSAERR